MLDARSLFKQLTQADSPTAESDFMHTLMKNPYTNLRNLVDELTDAIRLAEDSDFPQIITWIDRANRLIPQPAEISPYYQMAWEQLSKMVAFKQEVFDTFSKDIRTGEWQIVFNNPNSNDELLCVPALTFTEASYLFAKYKLDLKKAEILRLQRVVDHLTLNGEL